MNVLVTGGAGYIGSHIVLELLEAGYNVCVVDNLSNSSRESLKRVEALSGKTVDFHEFDLCDEKKTNQLFKSTAIDAVIHLAGYKSVAESVMYPLKYFQNNLGSTIALCKAMEESHIYNLVFSSSSTVYGNPSELPLRETSRVGEGIANPYGQTKYMIEQLLNSMADNDKKWKITILRYFNPIGAHKSGLIGEDPIGLPNNLLPFISQVAIAKRKKVTIFGNDYDTADGTGVRDYLHVVDVAKGHLAALAHTPKNKPSVYNLSSGEGKSVLEVIKTFEAVSGKKIPYEVSSRRPGDLAEYYADSSLARKKIDWKTEYSLEDACRHAWQWQQKNPNGYSATQSIRGS